MPPLTGKVAFITGGARGQGQAAALRLARDGADIVFCDLGDAASLEETRSAVDATGRRCIAETADVRDQVALDALVSRAIEELGGVDFLIANAGITGPLAPFWEVQSRDWQQVFDTNLKGAWQSAKAVAPHMMERQSGSIVFTSSVNGIEGASHVSAYASTKHGLIGLMRCIALELAPFGVRVNAVLPGAVDTPMIENPVTRRNIVGRDGATHADTLEVLRSYFALRGRTALPPSAIANSIAWLVSDEAEHVTGLELVVDGGHSLMPGANAEPTGFDD